MIPKDLREALGIHQGDTVQIEMAGDRFRIGRSTNPVDVFRDVSSRSDTTISMNGIKKDLEFR